MKIIEVKNRKKKENYLYFDKFQSKKLRGEVIKQNGSNKKIVKKIASIKLKIVVSFLCGITKKSRKKKHFFPCWNQSPC